MPIPDAAREALDRLELEVDAAAPSTPSTLTSTACWR